MSDILKINLFENLICSFEVLFATQSLMPYSFSFYFWTESFPFYNFSSLRGSEREIQNQLNS